MKEKKNSNKASITIRLIVTAVVLVSAGLGGWVFLAHLSARRQATDQSKATVAEERTMMDDAFKARDPGSHDAVLSRMKDHLNSGSHSDSADAAASCAMAEFLGRFQTERRDFDSAMAVATREKVFSFAIRDRATIEQHRQILRALMKSNERLTYTLEHGEDLLRTELEKANVPAGARVETLEGYTKPRLTTQAIQIRIRRDDQAAAQTGLEILDLLDTNWGKWQFDESIGKLRSEDHGTTTAYSVLVQKLQAAQEDHEKAKQELAGKLRVVQQELNRQAESALLK